MNTNHTFCMSPVRRRFFRSNTNPTTGVRIDYVCNLNSSTLKKIVKGHVITPTPVGWSIGDETAMFFFNESDWTEFFITG